eukprot:1153749-Pelagomonas_calceolata.AAC.2
MGAFPEEEWWERFQKPHVVDEANFETSHVSLLVCALPAQAVPGCRKLHQRDCARSRSPASHTSISVCEPDHLLLHTATPPCLSSRRTRSPWTRPPTNHACMSVRRPDPLLVILPFLCVNHLLLRTATTPPKPQ